MSEIATVPDIQLSDNEQQEGVVVDTDEVLTLDLSDAELNQISGSRIDDAKKWWDEKLNLTNVRALAEKYYVNDTIDEDELYDYQVPYKNNRIVIDIETLAPMAVANAAEPVVTEANDTEASRQLAMDLQNVLMAQYEDLYLKAKLLKVARHLLMGKRIGILKYWFDPNRGRLMPDGERKGVIVVENVRPEKVVIAEETGPNDNPLFIAEYLTATIEDLIHKFPKKKDAIFKDQGIVRGTKKQLQKVVGYIECWFTYYDKSGEVQEGTFWKLNQVILDKMKNPNWNYDGYEEVDGNFHNLNFLEMPEKPYILFSHLDTDKYIYDETSLIDQAIPLQDVLNKRGRQIVENADQAGSGMVYNTEMMSQEDAAKLIGDPSEKLGVAGDVRMAFARIPPNMLPQYVLNDKLDARAEIDNIFGANAPIKGEESGIKTLGQEIISQRANIGRLQPIADSLEDGMDRLYKALVQMMKVYWDEEEIIRFNESEGKTQFINFSRDKIEDGVKVRVKAGSALPKDKFAIRNETIQSLAVLDPLSIAEGLDKPNPKEWAKRNVYYHFFMDKYLAMIEGDEGGLNAQAMADLQILMQGRQPPIPEDVSKEYLATFEQFISSQGFKVLEPQIKENIIVFVETITGKVKGDLGEQPEETEQIEQGGTPPEQAGVNIQEMPEEGQEEANNSNILSKGVQALRTRFGL